MVDANAISAGAGEGPKGSPSSESSASSPSWQEALAPYIGPDLRLSALNVLTSVVPYLGLSVLMYLLLGRSYLVLLLAIPAAGFLVRTYIVFHDCTHGSFLPTKRANAWLGITCGLLVFQPFACWRHSHAVHHATAGDLDRRGVGDVPVITVAEYHARSWRGRLLYRLFRNPVVMFGLGPIIALIVQPANSPARSPNPYQTQRVGH